MKERAKIMRINNAVNYASKRLTNDEIVRH